ncbi:MAG: ABC transporter permease [bacterium]
MNIYETIKLAISNFLSYPLRSSLTTLGVIIGVASLMLVLSIIEAGRQRIMGEINEMGTDLVWIYPDSSKTDKAGRPLAKLSAEDLEAIRRECPAVVAISPEISAALEANGPGRHMTLSVTGIFPGYEEINRLSIFRGRFLGEIDASLCRRVCVVEEGVETRKLFGAADPLNQDILLGGVEFKVVGVVKEEETRRGKGEAEIYLPMTTLQQMVGRQEFSAVTARVGSTEGIRQITTVLARRHQGRDEFGVNSAAELIKRSNKIAHIVALVGGIIAGISLLVGGIGIANIMLVTVTERTREIGIRKAIGAKSRLILAQFLTEAVLLSLLGGLTGMGIGLAGARLISTIFKLPLSTPIWIIAVGVFFSAMTGIISGLYPAYRAAKLHPIEALRYE